MFTFHADTHDGWHGAYDNCQENDEHDQVTAEQDATRTVQLPSVHEVERQDADPPAETQAASEMESKEPLWKTQWKEVNGVNTFQNKARFTLELNLPQ